MTTQPEQVLENNLITQLNDLGHKVVTIHTEEQLLSNLKSQLEKHNKTSFTESEFKRILIYLSKGNIFDKAKTLRDKFALPKDNGDKEYIEFINQDYWCQNEFQVTNQVTIHGKRENRYDVTLLINGLPLVQIELKRRGIELKKAFNQIQRYQKDSFGANNALFQYIQLFVISNGVNTKYYANSPKQSFKQTFFWSDDKNKRISQLTDFANVFLEPCHIAKMITKYTVLHESDKILMILRPYQFYAVEAIIDRVRNSTKNGYIWHTTGSGKTLTSFKASQILTHNPKIKKVVFVVDRQDLDDQTVKEFRAFQKESIDGTDDTKMLVKQFLDNSRPLMVTTIQKLNTAISKARFKKQIEKLRDDKIVFIFDECHRSQFGDTHKRIVAFFTNHQMFGFTGTPILEKNAHVEKSLKYTTASLFDKCLHQYVITDAIRDENVLKFSIEYYNVFKAKNNFDDSKVEGINTKEVYESEKYTSLITDYIIANHNRKTHNRTFTAMFCVSDTDALVRYYSLFKKRKEDEKHNLKIATIFSFGTNEDDKNADGFIPDEENISLAAESEAEYAKLPKRDKLDEYITDYNEMFNSKHSAKDGQSFLNYKKDISKRVRNRDIDILLVVNMFLTGFDSKTLNTLYVDKNLKYHGLIQAYSRTNRILNEKKSQGNILAFRNLKKATDEAVKLFSDKNANETITIEPYEEYLKQFNAAYKKLMSVAPTPNSVDDLVTEEDELEFAKAFREIMRLKNILSSFTSFTFDDTYMQEQQFADYSSKYQDLYQKIRTNQQKENVSILDSIDFELELLRKDDIDVAYIMRLLKDLKDANEKDKSKKKQAIIDLVAGDTELRSKRELIEKFINQNLPNIEDGEEIEDNFKEFWEAETKIALEDLSKEEALVQVKIEKIINDYMFTGRMATEDEVIDALEKQPSVLQRESISGRVTDKILDFVKTFISGI